MVRDSSSWTVIPFSAKRQPEDISMMEILSTWLDALVDNMCSQKYYKNIWMLIWKLLYHIIYRFCEVRHKQLAVQEKQVSFPSILILNCSRVKFSVPARKLNQSSMQGFFNNVFCIIMITLSRTYNLTHSRSKESRFYQLCALLVSNQQVVFFLIFYIHTYRKRHCRGPL